MNGNWLWWIILLCCFGATAVCYLFFYRYRQSVGFHVAMNLAMTSSTLLGTTSGIVIGYQFSESYAFAAIATTFIAAAVGALFGSLGDQQTVLAGLSSGTMTGMMSPMLGAHAGQPLGLLLFSTALLFICFGLFCYSHKT
ncbi:hypothetical protein LOK74_13990 [Brevibacillus humidisoli]|uniref:hypothetical protein n=1 Tax=Brevibacillus humidisoli TaxID=2895522 RepID=UPI001E409956|nr:hypothetical protein [Brevibacillus humidisoli]UFJ39180.1 hypothetical protein LOK74_13990 [Brevibacillus humidisoli]